MSAGFTVPVQDWPRTRAADRAAGLPFRTAADAWFWTMAALLARREGRAGGAGVAPRPVEPDDVVKVVDRLYRSRRITLDHARVLRTYGERGVPPYPQAREERADALLWVEAMTRMDWPLRVKGIVA